MYIFVVGNLNENHGENISVEAMAAVVKVFVKFVWCIGYKWWTVDTYQSYVTDKQSKQSVGNYGLSGSGGSQWRKGASRRG